MATTTTNFGWDIPQSTDLVKDGATAIAALGQDIDSALVDLKGGTTGQVLAKASGTDLDFSWVAQDDSNAIQNAIVDAKGDLISATGADTPARLAVGTNGQVLTADSTTATGLKWATPASGGLVYITGATWTNVSAQSINNCFTSTYQNYRIVGRIKCITSSSTAYMRLRVSGTDNTTSNYYSLYDYLQIDSSTNGVIRKSADSVGWVINSPNANGYIEFSLDVYAPQMSLESQFVSQSSQKFDSFYYTATGGGVFNATTSFDGFTLYNAGQNTTGEVRVYGYQNS